MRLVYVLEKVGESSVKERPGKKKRRSKLTEETNKVTSTVMHAGR